MHPDDAAKPSGRSDKRRARSRQRREGHATVTPRMTRRQLAVQAKPRPFRTEAALVRAFVSSLHSGAEPWNVRATMKEFPNQNGRTDIVAVSGTGQVVAIEAKLEKWKDAMHQAYRNTSYSHLSYVLLPEPVALRAKHALPEFQRRGVGICTLRGGEVVVLHHPEPVQPLQPWLSERASAAAKPVRSSCRTKNSKQ
jgi:hypothetical protein